LKAAALGVAAAGRAPSFFAADEPAAFPFEPEKSHIPAPSDSAEWRETARKKLDYQDDLERLRFQIHRPSWGRLFRGPQYFEPWLP
jgi:hypothetical protein